MHTLHCPLLPSLLAGRFGKSSSGLVCLHLLHVLVSDVIVEGRGSQVSRDLLGYFNRQRRNASRFTGPKHPLHCPLFPSLLPRLLGKSSSGLTHPHLLHALLGANSILCPFNRQSIFGY